MSNVDDETLALWAASERRERERLVWVQFYAALGTVDEDGGFGIKAKGLYADGMLEEYRKRWEGEQG